MKLDDITESGEHCLRRLATLQAHHFGGYSPDEWTIVATATVVETHTSNLLARLFTLSGVETHSVGRALYTQLRDDVFRTWDSRMSWLGRAFTIHIAGDSPYQRFRVLVDLRNALVHGDGSITDYQARDLNKLIRLQKQLDQVLKVQCLGRRVAVSSYTPSLGLSVARDFVEALDHAAVSVNPKLKLRMSPLWRSLP